MSGAHISGPPTCLTASPPDWVAGGAIFQQPRAAVLRFQHPAHHADTPPPSAFSNSFSPFVVPRLANAQSVTSLPTLLLQRTCCVAASPPAGVPLQRTMRGINAWLCAAATLAVASALQPDGGPSASALPRHQLSLVNTTRVALPLVQSGAAPRASLRLSLEVSDDTIAFPTWEVSLVGPVPHMHKAMVCAPLSARPTTPSVACLNVTAGAPAVLDATQWVQQLCMPKRGVPLALVGKGCVIGSM